MTMNVNINTEDNQIWKLNINLMGRDMKKMFTDSVIERMIKKQNNQMELVLKLSEG